MAKETFNSNVSTVSATFFAMVLNEMMCVWLSVCVGVAIHVFSYLLH